MKNQQNIYAIDKSTLGVENMKSIKYIAKSYKKNGEIIYYEDGEKEDGFSNIIQSLNQGEETYLYANKDKLKPTFEFIEELKFSVENAKLRIIFRDEDKTEEVSFSF